MTTYTTIPAAPVATTQSVVHPRLAQVVDRHCQAQWQRPLHPPSVAAFAQLAALLGPHGGQGVILDSGCGTGASTRAIAAAFPDDLVIGIDRSAARLGRLHLPHLPWREGNAVWLRAELATIWRLMLQAGWRLSRHFLLYPNPSPKPGHLKRRWHAHPAFPDLLALGGNLEMRCNWRIYAEEFACATALATGLAVTAEAVVVTAVTTPFEQKYRARGQPLWRVAVALG